jgi:hypothetical protein
VRAGALHEVLVARARTTIATIRTTRSAGDATDSRTVGSMRRHFGVLLLHDIPSDIAV